MNTITSESGNVSFTGNVAQITEYASASLFNPSPLPITITRNTNGNTTITFMSTGWTFVVNLSTNKVISQNLSGANVIVESGIRIIIDFRLINTDVYTIIVTPVSASVTVSRYINLPVGNSSNENFIIVTRTNIGLIDANGDFPIGDNRFSPSPYPVKIVTTPINEIIIPVYTTTITINNTSITYIIRNNRFSLVGFTTTNVKVVANDTSFSLQFPYKNGILGDRYEGRLRLNTVASVLLLSLSTPVLDVTVFRSKKVTI